MQEIEPETSDITIHSSSHDTVRVKYTSIDKDSWFLSSQKWLPNIPEVKIGVSAFSVLALNAVELE